MGRLHTAQHNLDPKDRKNQQYYAAGHAATLVGRPTTWFEAIDFNPAMREYGELFDYDQQSPNPDGVPVIWAFGMSHLHADDLELIAAKRAVAKPIVVPLLDGAHWKALVLFPSENNAHAWQAYQINPPADGRCGQHTVDLSAKLIQMGPVQFQQSAWARYLEPVDVRHQRALQTIAIQPAQIVVRPIEPVKPVVANVTDVVTKDAKNSKRAIAAPSNSFAKRQRAVAKTQQTVEPIPAWAAKTQSDIDAETSVMDRSIVGMQHRTTQSIHQHMHGLNDAQQQAFLLSLFQQACASEATISNLDFIVRYTDAHPAQQNWHALTQAEQIDRLAVAARVQTQGADLYRFDFAKAKAAAGQLPKASASHHTACAEQVAHPCYREDANEGALTTAMQLGMRAA